MKNLYYKMYESVNDVPGRSVVISPDKVMDEINAARDADMLMPVFEPVFMTETEFNNLPGFDGF